MKGAVLDIRECDRTYGNTDRTWYFLKHKVSNYDLRWVIGYRKKDNWWGVIALFPATISSAIDEIPKEMELAKEAIRILSEQN